MFGPDLGDFHSLSLSEEEDSFGKRLLLAVLPGAIATLIPVTYEAWKDHRAAKKGGVPESAENDESETDE